MVKQGNDKITKQVKINTDSQATFQLYEEIHSENCQVFKMDL